MPRVAVLFVCMVLFFCPSQACTERRHYGGPESLVFNSHAAHGPALTQNIQGFVSCVTCDRAASSMIVEVSAPESSVIGYLAEVPFANLGAYEVKVQVVHDELLEVQARIFTQGGVRLVKQRVRASADEELAENTMTLDLFVE